MTARRFSQEVLLKSVSNRGQDEDKGQENLSTKRFSQKEEGLLHSIRNWVQNECEDQDRLMTWYELTPAKSPKLEDLPYPSVEESLATIELQLASISADQARVAAYYGAQQPYSDKLKGNQSVEEILHAILVTHVQLAHTLKGIVKIENGQASPPPIPVRPPYPSAEATLASITEWLDKSSKDLKALLLRTELAPGPDPEPASSPFPPVEQSLRNIEHWWTKINQDLLATAREAPRRNLNMVRRQGRKRIRKNGQAKPKHPH